ncbi:MAG: hypothetical protein U0935_15390 [Pirellulales bacterium]
MATGTRTIVGKCGPFSAAIRPFTVDAAQARVYVNVNERLGFEVGDRVTFSLDGRYAYPSTLEVIDTRTRQIVAALRDEQQRRVQSEKVVEIEWQGGRVVRTGDQFG